MTVYENVYSLARETQQSIAEDVQELEKVENDIKSNRYTQEAIQNELYPKRATIRDNINTKKRNFLKSAKETIEERKKEINDQYKLNPKDITEDIKLLQLGVKLNEREVKDIFERNKDNKTMVQIIKKYVEENNLNVTVLDNKYKEFNALDGYYNMIERYVNNFIDSPKRAVDILERNFKLFM